MTGRSTHAWPGVPLALTAAILFGLSTPISKILLGAVPPPMLAGLLYAGSGVGLWFLSRLKLTLGLAQEAPLRRGDWPWVVGIVLTGGVVGPLLLIVGLAVTPASIASLLLNLEGVFTLGIAWMVFRENVDVRVGLGAGAILLAAALLSRSAGAGQFHWGSVAIVGACAAWSIDNNLTRKLSASDPVQLAMIKGLVAGSFNILISVWFGARWPGAAALGSAAAVGFAGYGVSLVCFILAMRHLGAARTAAYFSFAPFVGASVAILAFGEPFTATFLAAAGLMAAGLMLHLAERHEHVHVHEPMEHEHRHVHDAHHQHAHGPDDPPGEPHTHWHQHDRLEHPHPHYPDIHHRHDHS